MSASLAPRAEPATEAASVVRAARSARPQRERRVLAVLRWPLGGIRTHLLYIYPRLAEAGYRFTFVGPANSSLETLAQSLDQLEGCEYVGVAVRGQSCPLWSTTRALL